MTDDLERLLTPTDVESDSAMPPALLAATTGLISRRRWHVPMIATTAAMAIFAAGLAVGWFAKPTPEPIIVFLPAPVEPPLPPAEPKPEPEAELTAGKLEVKAELSDDPSEVADLYRRAGDKYLNDERAPDEAARCYARYLRTTGPKGLAIDKSDSWLLMELKILERRREIRHANVLP